LSIELAKWWDVLWYTDSRRSPRVERPNGGPDPAHCLISGSFTVCLMETALEIVVRPTEVDVNGHVNNAKYVDYMEWREEWYERQGLPYARLFALGAVTVTANLNLNFRQECRQGEFLVITTRPERLGRTSFAFHQEIRRRDGTLAAGVITVVTIDPATRKSRPVPDELAATCRS